MAAARTFSRAPPYEATVRPKRGKVTNVAWILPLLLGIYLLLVAWRCLVRHDQQSSPATQVQSTAPEVIGAHPVTTTRMKAVSDQGRGGGKLLRVNHLHKTLEELRTEKGGTSEDAMPLGYDGAFSDETPGVELPPELKKSIDAGTPQET